MIFLLLSVSALGQVESAQLLKIEVNNVPAAMQDAYVVLDKETWLPLQHVSEGAWEGEFLLLSGLYDEIPQPDVRFLDLHGKEYLVEEGTDVRMTSSAHRLSNLEGILEQDVRVVVSGAIDKDTLVIEDSSGELRYPVFVGSTFVLPALGVGEMASVHVLTEDGIKVSYAFGHDVDLAELEESLSQ